MHTRRCFLAAAAAAGTALRAVAQPASAADPASDETWTDPRRARTLPLRLRWPAGSQRAAVLLYSHGLGGSRAGGDVWGQAWRDAGFIVVHLQHPGSDTEALRGGPRGVRAAASADQLLARGADVAFVIDEIERRAREPGSPWARARLDALGVAGHSFGAHTTLAVAGQRFAQRQAPSLRDPRPKAFIALSPSPGRGAVDVRESFGAIERPLLVATGTHDGDPLGRGLSGEDRARVYDGLPSGGRALLWLDGADHFSFGGNGERSLRARSGPLRREAVAAQREAAHHALIARITTEWWRAHLLGDAAAMAALRAPAGLQAADRWRMD